MIFDTHCHLAGKELFNDAIGLGQRAYESGVKALCMISAEELSLVRMAELSAQIVEATPGLHVYYTAGIHPHEALHLDEDLKQKVRNVELSGARAIGETGLDYHYNFSDLQSQKDAFRWHIDLAAESKKPLVIHCREARDDIYSMLDCQEVRSHENPGILHCFTENREFARKLLDLNFYISFSGILTFKNASELREVAQYVPLNRLLVETDSPYLAPVPYRGKSNEPAYVKEVLKVVQSLRSEPEEEVTQQIWENSQRVFGLLS